MSFTSRLRNVSALLALPLLAALSGCYSDVTARPLKTPPSADKLVFWSPTEQEVGYRSMEHIFPTHIIHRGRAVAPLPDDSAGQVPITLEFEHRHYTIDDFMSVDRASGLLIVQDGKVLLERYGLGRKAKDRWPSLSIANSVISTLVGAAIQDGYIASVHDPVTKYLPQLTGRAYAGVTIEQMLTMSSGVQWFENYDNPNSDFNRYANDLSDQFLREIADRRRMAQPGKKFVFSTADATLIGAVVSAATHRPLSQYLSEKVWAPLGMERDGIWITSRGGQDIGGLGFSATLRDYARFGLFLLADGVIDRKRVLPVGWVAEATREHIVSSFIPYGYGYYWWTRGAGVYQGIGIFGQSLYVDPSRRLIIVVQSAWSTPGDAHNSALQTALFHAVAQLLDARRSH